MDYRNDLEASRLRINTLEAKLEETKAALNAREAELAECRNERDRLRQTASTKAPPSRWGYVITGVLGIVIGGLLGFGICGVMLFGTAERGPDKPATPVPTTTYKERGSEIGGQIKLPPATPPTPPAVVKGQTGEVTPTLPAIVAGQTGEATPGEKTIHTVIEDARPKVRACYREEAKAHPNVSGSVSVNVVIEPGGKASSTKLEAMPYQQPWWSKTFETCVVEVYRGLKFPNDSENKVTARGTYFLGALDLTL